MDANEDEALFDKLKNHLCLKKRFNEILGIAENTSGELITADEAETKAIEEVRKLGKEVIQEWAENQHKQQVETLLISIFPKAVRLENWRFHLFGLLGLF